MAYANQVRVNASRRSLCGLFGHISSPPASRDINPIGRLDPSPVLLDDEHMGLHRLRKLNRGSRLDDQHGGSAPGEGNESERHQRQGQHLSHKFP